MDKLLEKIKHYKVNSREYLNSRVLFAVAVIGVLTVFNLGANLFNSYMAFSGKADQQKLREAQVQIMDNLHKLEKQQQSIEELQIQQDATEARADDSDKRQTASDTRQDKSNVRQTKSEKNPKR